MLDWLKDLVAPRRRAVSKPAVKQANNYVRIDNRNYTLRDINKNGFVAQNFDGSLIVDQSAKILVVIDDAYGKFQFSSTVTITQIANNQDFAGVWGILPVEVDAVIGRYLQNRRAAAAKRPPHR